MAETYEQHLQNLKSSQRQSARKAVDYMDGYQLGHLMDYLDSPSGIKKWKSRGVLPIYENITGMIIEKSSQTYQDQPAREVDAGETTTTRYNQILEESNIITALEDADMISRLLKTAIVLYQINGTTGKIYASVLGQHNADVYYDRVSGEFKSLFYTAGGVGPNGGKLYYHWTPDKISEFEEVKGGAGLAWISSEPNDYGFIPAATLFDIRPPRYGFWHKPVWEQLINLNLGINMYHTEIKFNQRYGAIGTLFTNARIKDGTVIGPDSSVMVDTSNPDSNLFLEYRSPQVQITEFQAWLDALRESIGFEWGVNIKTAGEGSADSGFKLIVEELSGLQLRKKRQKPAVDFEQQMYAVIARIMGLPDSRISVTFPAPDLPVNKKEAWDVAAGEMASGVLSKEQYLRRQYPNWTDEQIEAELAAARAETIGTVPDFGGI